MNLSMYSGFSDTVKKEGIEKAAEIARMLGFDSVEFLDMQSCAPIIPNASAAKEYRRVLEGSGLSVSCFSFGLSIIDPLDTSFPTEDAVNRLLFSAEMAALVGSPYFHHTLILNLSYDENNYVNDFGAITERLLPHVLRVARRCEELGITALYEPQGFYVNGKERFPEFYRVIKGLCNNVGVCGDIGNPNFCDWRGEDFFSEMAAEIKHVHLKDYRIYPAHTRLEGIKAYTSVQGRKLQPVLLGEGDIDVSFCLESLKAAGYKGALSLEGEYGSLEEIESDIFYLKRLIG